MLRTILLALDHSHAGRQAQRYALTLAQHYNASITAVGIVDTPWITAAQPEPLGGSSFKTNHDEVLIQESHHHVKHMITDYVKACNEVHVTVRTVETEGFPAVVIERLAHEHDIIVMGKTADFHFDVDDSTDEIVRHVARDNSRPLIIVPEHVPNKGKILVTLDGSVAASKALHMLIMLGLAQNQNVEILSIHRDTELAHTIAKRGVSLCQAHTITASSRVIESHNHEAEIILNHAISLDAQLIVMGGFSHSSFKEVFFGSRSQYMLEHSQIPLFMYH